MPAVARSESVHENVTVTRGLNGAGRPSGPSLTTSYVGDPVIPLAPSPNSLGSIFVMENEVGWLTAFAGTVMVTFPFWSVPPAGPIEMPPDRAGSQVLSNCTGHTSQVSPHAKGSLD